MKNYKNFKKNQEQDAKDTFLELEWEILSYREQ